MSDMEKKNGIETLSDDELDAVAGGEMYDSDSLEYKLMRAKSKAKQEGRSEQIKDSTGLCECNIKFVFAKSVEKTFGGKTYYDVKCYNCGKTWKKYKDFFA